MKKIIVLLFTVLAMITITIAQTTKKTWRWEMKTFHSFMSSTFHPSEDGDLAPLKAKATVC